MGDRKLVPSRIFGKVVSIAVCTVLEEFQVYRDKDGNPTLEPPKEK